MVTASQLRPGMAIAFEHQTYKVLDADYHPGQGKMGGVTHSRLFNVDTRTQWEHNFRADLKLEDLPLLKVQMDFLYPDGDLYHFMNPETFEQVALSGAVIGPQARFLVPQMRLGIEFIGERPIGVIFPEIIEVHVADTAPPMHQLQESAYKNARLENGVDIAVPQFIKTGDLVRVEVRTLKYMDRVRAPTKAG